MKWVSFGPSPTKKTSKTNFNDLKQKIVTVVHRVRKIMQTLNIYGSQATFLISCISVGIPCISF